MLQVREAAAEYSFDSSLDDEDSTGVRKLEIPVAIIDKIDKENEHWGGKSAMTSLDECRNIHQSLMFCDFLSVTQSMAIWLTHR